MSAQWRQSCAAWEQGQGERPETLILGPPLITPLPSAPTNPTQHPTLERSEKELVKAMKEVAGQIGSAVNKLSAAMGMIATDHTQSFKQASLESMRALKELATRTAQFSVPLVPPVTTRQPAGIQPIPSSSSQADPSAAIVAPARRFASRLFVESTQNCWGRSRVFHFMKKMEIALSRRVIKYFFEKCTYTRRG